MSQPSSTPTADAVQAWLKAQQRPATGITQPLSPVPEARSLPSARLLPLFVLCFIVGLLVSQHPALIIGGMGLVVAIAWKLEA